MNHCCRRCQLPTECTAQLVGHRGVIGNHIGVEFYNSRPASQFCLSYVVEYHRPRIGLELLSSQRLNLLNCQLQMAKYATKTIQLPLLSMNFAINF